MTERAATFLSSDITGHLDDQLEYHMSLSSFLILFHRSMGLSLRHLDLRLTFANGESRLAALSNEHEYEGWLRVADEFPRTDVVIDPAACLVTCTVDLSRVCAPADLSAIAPHTIVVERQFSKLCAAADAIGVPASSAIPHFPRASTRMRAVFDRDMRYYPLALPSPYTLGGSNS